MCLLAGMDGDRGRDGDGGNKQLVYNPHFGRDPFWEVLCCPLSSYPPIVLGNFGYSNLVLQIVKDCLWIMGVSCVGYEKQFIALLTVIEERRHLEE